MMVICFFVFGVIFFFISLKNKLKCLKFSKTHILVMIAFPKSLFSFLLLFSLSPLSLCMEGISGLKMMVKFTWASQNEKKAFLFFKPQLGSSLWALWQCHFTVSFWIQNNIMQHYVSLQATRYCFFFFKETILILYLCPIALRKVWINKKCPNIWLSIITI